MATLMEGCTCGNLTRDIHPLLDSKKFFIKKVPKAIAVPEERVYDIKNLRTTLLLADA